MEKNAKVKVNIIVWVVIALSILGTIFIYPSLPEQIPIHWNLQGEVDNYGGKVSAFLTALLPLIIAVLLIVIPRVDPRRDSYKKHQKAYEIVVNVLLIFFVLIHWATMLAALGYEINIGLFIGIVVGILFIVIGNYMGQIRHNYTFGIRTPWTLANEQVWVKTHRLGKWVFIISGVLFIINGIVANTIVFIASIIYLIGSLLYLTLYSYLEFRKLQ